MNLLCCTVLHRAVKRQKGKIMINIKKTFEILGVSSAIIFAVVGCSDKNNDGTITSAVSNPTVSHVDKYTIGGYKGITYSVKFIKTESGEKPVMDNDYFSVNEKLEKPDIGIYEDPYSTDHIYLLENKEQVRSIIDGIRIDHPSAPSRNKLSASLSQSTSWGLYDLKNRQGAFYGNIGSFPNLGGYLDNKASSLYIYAPEGKGFYFYDGINYTGRYYLVISDRVDENGSHYAIQDDLGRMCLRRNIFGCQQTADNCISSIYPAN